MRFYVSDESLRLIPSMAEVLKLVEATNKRLAIWRDARMQMIVVEAENKPEDSPTYGIKWKEG